MTARSSVFQIYQPNFSEWKASSSLISDCFFMFFFFISIREKSDQRLFFSVFWMQQSITSPYFLKLLICTGNLRASLVPAYYRDKFSFCKKMCIGLCFTDDINVALKNFKWPTKKSEGGQTWPSKLLTWGQHRAFTEGCTTLQNSKLI